MDAYIFSSSLFQSSVYDTETFNWKIERHDTKLGQELNQLKASKTSGKGYGHTLVKSKVLNKKHWQHKRQPIGTGIFSWKLSERKDLHKIKKIKWQGVTDKETRTKKIPRDWN